MSATPEALTIAVPEQSTAPATTHIDTIVPSIGSVLDKLQAASQGQTPPPTEIHTKNEPPRDIVQVDLDSPSTAPRLPIPELTKLDHKNKKIETWIQKDADGKPLLATIDRQLRSADRANNYANFNEIPHEMMREQALGVMELKGFISKGKNGEVICHLDRFKGDNNYRDDLWTLLGPIARNEKYKYRPFGEALVDIFADLDVYSEEDYERLNQGETVSPKKLFYIPDNKESAFNLEKIKNSNSYMGLWDIGTGKSRGKILGGYRYPTVKEGWENDMPDHESIIAAIVYHPQYGKGYRTENGDLMVTYPDGTERKLSFQFFEDWGYGGIKKGERDTAIYHSPTKYILDYCPTLRERGLVKPEDFKVIHSHELMPSRKLTETGIISFDQIGYNLGRSMAREDVRVFKLNDDSAAIIDYSKGDGEITGLFKLQPPTKEELHSTEPLNGNRRTVGVADIEFVYKAKENTPDQLLRHLVTLPRKQQELLMGAVINFQDYAQIVNTLLIIQTDPTITKAVRDNVEFWGKKLRGLDNGLQFHNIQTFYGIFEKGKVDMSKVAEVSINRKRQIELVKKYLPAEENGLTVDVACGLGELLFAVANDEEVKSKNLQFLGYDAAKDYVEEAQKFASTNGFANVNIVEGDWKATPVEPGEASLITCVGRSGHHMNGYEEADKFFADKARTLKPGGIIIFDALDPTTGLYRQNRLNLIQKLGNLGKNFRRFGAKAQLNDYLDEFPYTVDAPWGNDKDFFNRFTPSIEKWQEMAAEHDLELVEFMQEPIFPHDITRDDHDGKRANELNCTMVFRKKAV